ncbi:MAG: hypothetical protein Q8P53_00235 [Candidatus Shapirobacteria bacterium]|nr:hypothetical protein [Candidatus Shapirobacteria bacterium]
MKIRKDSGQNLIEVTFAIAIIIMVITGVVILMVYTMGNKTKVFDRKKASQVAEIVTEGLVEQKRNDSENFWKLIDIGETSLSGLSEYVYTVGFTNIDTGMNSNCGVGITDCANVVIEVSSQDNTQSVIFNRFFTRK